MGDILIVRGGPGTGKTTLAEVLASNSRSPVMHAAADDHMVDEDGNYAFDPTRLTECHGKCMVQVEDWMRAKCSLIIVHNTFTKNWEMGAYFSLAKEYNYRVHVVIKEGAYGNIHQVPEETIKRMKDSFEPLEMKGISRASPYKTAIK